MRFIELELPYDRYKAVQEPLIIALDQIESIAPSEYRDGGIAPKQGSAVRTRSGETFVVAMTPRHVATLVDEVAE